MTVLAPLAASPRRRWISVGAAAVLAVSLGACSSSPKSASSATTGTPTSAPKKVDSASTLTGNSPCEKSGPPASEGQVLDGAGHFHRGPTAQVPLSEATRLELQQQQILARAVV